MKEYHFHSKIINFFAFINVNPSLKKFNLNNYNFIQESSLPNSALCNFISNSRLKTLYFYNVIFTVEQFFHLCEVLKENQTINRLKLENMFFINFKDKNLGLSVIMKQHIDALIMILLSLEYKINYKKFSVFFCKIEICDYIFEEKDFLTNKDAELYLGSINSFLINNRRLKMFNLYIGVPDEYLLEYSKIILNALYRNKELQVINYIDFLEIFDSQKANILAFNYTTEFDLSNNIDDFYFNLKMSSLNFLEYIPIIVFELLIKFQPFIINKLIIKLFGKGANVKCKSLTINKFNEPVQKSYVYKFNFIQIFCFLEKLVISGIEIGFLELDVIEKNIKKLESLQTIKLVNNFYKTNDISGLFEANHLTYLKIVNSTINTDDLVKFSKRIKSSCLEKLTLKNLTFYKDEHDDCVFFKSLIESINCASLKSLKIYINYTPHLLDLLNRGIIKFINLEHLGLSVPKDYFSFKKPLKKLINLIQEKQTMIAKVKFYEYIWDVVKLQRAKNLNLAGCSLGPVDIMIFARLCKNQIIKNVKIVDLSENMEIFDDEFVKYIVKIIKGIGCVKVVMKNIGCEQKHIEIIKNLLESEKSSCIELVIS